MALTRLNSFSQQPSELPDVPSPSMTPDQIRTKWQKPLDEILANIQKIVDDINSTAKDASGADNVGATNWDGVTSSTVGALLSWLKANKTDLTGDHKGTWQGYTPSKADPGISSVVDQHTQQLTDIVTVNVKLFGAKGDGVTDDTQALRNALRSTDLFYNTIDTDHNGRLILLPQGTYLISDTLYLRKGDILIGNGGTSTIIKCNNDITMLKMGWGLINGTETQDSGGLACQVEGIYFENTANGMGIETNIAGYRVKDCWFTCPYGIHAMGTEGIIDSCISDTGTHLLYLDGDGNGSTHNIIVTNCITYAPSYASVRFEGVKDITFVGCMFFYSKFYSVYTSDNTKANDRISFSNCKFITSDDSTYYDPSQQHMRLGTKTTNMSIDDCMFYNSRNADIDFEHVNIENVTVNSCKFFNSANESILGNNGKKVKFNNCDWTNTGSYPIDSNITITVKNCDFYSPFVNGVPTNEYDKGCVRCQNANGNIIEGCTTDSTQVYVAVFRSGSILNETMNNRSKYTLDVYFYCTDIQTSLNERSKQEGYDNLVVKGYNGNSRLFYWNAPPTTGTFSVGDRIVNSVPTVGQPKAWICTVAGTPGTWVSEGNL